ncbi:MAG TPA: leucyl aminopeptidase [Actinomycetes bacterium]|jgi:leucyl aminopeptidase|nr:leucyl aminopeptidase [Actinomycetes bacterium]
MEVALGTADALAAPADLLAVGVFADLEPGPGAREAIDGLGTPIQPLLEGRGFSGKAGEAVALPTLGRLPAATLLLVGLGERDKVDAETLRLAGGVVVREARGAKRAVSTLPQALAGNEGTAVRAVTEAVLLAAYRFDKYKASANGGDGGRRPSLERLQLVPGEGADRDALERALSAGRAVAAATNLARDLVNEPANNLHPADLAAAAARAVDGKGVTVTVKDEGELAAEGFGGIVGVGQGAANPPRLVELRYEPEGARSRVVLVGKGITFDSGGLSLKPPDAMIAMKTDMSGAATVVGVMSVLRDLGVGVAVTGYLASAENMPSGQAIRPGDVLKMKNGKTVEVVNTDAEGRLVMADALALGAASQPDAVVDVATLTGACMVALGKRYTGLMSNDDGLAAELLEAAGAAGERTWRLPLPEEYRKELDSEVADLKNVGDRYGGALIAGLFLQEFVDGRPWAHLDIAGPARRDSEDGYIGKGASGAAVRTLLSWLERRSSD